MLQLDRPGDYVIATGESHTVQEFVELAFAHIDLDWRRYVLIDPAYYRPSEVDELCGDATKARVELEWKPQTGFSDLVRVMVDADIAQLEDELAGRTIRVDR
jgi:GDPmannose 4,6-dehydratase